MVKLADIFLMASEEAQPANNRTAQHSAPYKGSSAISEGDQSPMELGIEYAITN
jgi:hypothetical protein